MKSKNLVVWAIAVLFIPAWSNGNAQDKIRYLNSQEILDQLPEAQDIQKRLDEIRAGYETEYSKMIERFESLAKEIES